MARKKSKFLRDKAVKVYCSDVMFCLLQDFATEKGISMSLILLQAWLESHELKQWKKEKSYGNHQVTAA